MLSQKCRFSDKWPDLSSCRSASPTWRAIVCVGHLLDSLLRLKLGNGAASFWFDSWLQEGPLCKLIPYVHISDSDLSLKDVWRNWDWMLEALATPLSPEALNALRNCQVWLHQDSRDCKAWIHDTSSCYTVSSAYWWFYDKMFGSSALLG